MTTRTPTLFLSHGAPTLPIDPSLPSGGFTVLSEHLPKPQSVLMLSAHWGTMRPVVSTAAQPETIHDFYGFPRFSTRRPVHRKPHSGPRRYYAPKACPSTRKRTGSITARGCQCC
jgi:hypothetical protein